MLTAVFISGLFSLICPHCLAKMVMDADPIVTQYNDNEHCSHMGPANPAPVQSHNHCNGSCACEEHVMLSGPRDSVAITDHKGYPDIRMPVLNDTFRYESSFIDLPSIVGRPYKPDRACYSPLERNCVLLN